MIGSDGSEIRVIEIIEDATQMVAERNRFNDPPGEGNVFLIINIELVAATTGDSVTVYDWAFKLIGDNRVIYETSCGVIPDEFGGEVFGGGKLQGNLCFELPPSEQGLILIHEPAFSAEGRRFLSVTN